jgi:hypothetical protein
MADRRYSTAAWQRLRRAVIARDGGICQIQGPRCTQVATTCDHIYPTSTHPDLFWEPENLRAACGRCNYGRSPSIQRETIAELRAEVERQRYEIDRLLEQLAAYERERSQATPRKTRQIPAIY